jgi:hypothetical protein
MTSSNLLDRNYLELDTIRFTEDAILEIDYSYQVVAGVPRDQVESITLHHTSIAERPVATTVGAIGLCLLALYPWVVYFRVMSEGGRMNTILFGLTNFAILAAWMFYRVLRRRLVVEVHTTKEPRKLVFQDNVDPQEAEEFLLAAGERYGYRVMSRL